MVKLVSGADFGCLHLGTALKSEATFTYGAEQIVNRRRLGVL